VKVAFDTSVLVAGALARHAHAQRALAWLSAAREGRIEALAATHAFAETWATLTAIPGEPRIDPAVATRVVERLARHVRPFALRWEDYRAAFQRCGDGHLRSGAAYDALHLAGAARQAADVFLTFNTRHFSALAREGDPRIVAPPDPPALLRG
jgi:predicted nucleic acid-binding protein